MGSIFLGFAWGGVLGTSFFFSGVVSKGLGGGLMGVVVLEVFGISLLGRGGVHFVGGGETKRTGGEDGVLGCVVTLEFFGLCDNSGFLNKGYFRNTSIKTCSFLMRHLLLQLSLLV